MKILVLKRFRDKYDGMTRYQPGQTLDFEDERASDLIARGLAVAIEEPNVPPVDVAPGEAPEEAPAADVAPVETPAVKKPKSKKAE